MDIAITKMSSKGQIVIPAEMRENIVEGEKLIVIQNEDQFVLKKITDLDKNFEEDLEFAKKTELAWEAYKTGKFKSLNEDKFLKELEKW